MGLTPLSMRERCPLLYPRNSASSSSFQSRCAPEVTHVVGRVLEAATWVAFQKRAAHP